MRRTDQSACLQPGFNAWMTAAEIHEERLPGLGTSLSHVQAMVTEMRREGPSFLARMRRRLSHPDHPRGNAPGNGVEIHFTCLPLEAIVAYEARHRPGPAAATQTADRRYARLGKSVLAMAQGGQLRALILKTMIAEPRLPVVGVRDRCIERFGLDVVIIPQGMPVLVPMPPMRTFQAFVKMLRDTGMADAQP